MTWRPWRDAWQRSLYGEQGFYRQAAGPAAHFATSAQGIPGAGELLAAAVVTLADTYDCTTIVDLGAGRGELLTEVVAQGGDHRLVGVDVVERPALPTRIDWLRSPGGAGIADELTDLSDTLVIAHEWLDVVPCTVAEFDGDEWQLVEVDPSGAERLAGRLETADAGWLQRHWPAPAEVGERAEVGRPRDEAFAALRARIDTGLLVAVDYGHCRDDRPRHGTLTGFRGGTQRPPSADGSTDVTAHVAMDTLGADRLVRQRDLLAELGVEPPPPPIELARSDPPAYLRHLAQRSAYAALTARGGLGDFWWALTTIE